MGDLEKAKQSWQEASSTRADRPRRRGTGEGGPQLDRSVQRYYQALAQRKLGQGTEADATLHGLVDTANRALEREAAREDASTPIGERQSSSARTALAHYTAGLGHLGLGEMANAKQEFTLALQASPDHLGSKTALAQLQ